MVARGPEQNIHGQPFAPAITLADALMQQIASAMATVRPNTVRNA
tara:strand:+ start:1402 stop:1536 length:135 start_codon:yes stop_codon:yes gene_type:complete